MLVQTCILVYVQDQDGVTSVKESLICLVGTKRMSTNPSGSKGRFTRNDRGVASTVLILLGEARRKAPLSNLKVWRASSVVNSRPWIAIAIFSGQVGLIICRELSITSEVLSPFVTKVTVVLCNSSSEMIHRPCPFFFVCVGVVSAITIRTIVAIMVDGGMELRLVNFGVRFVCATTV